MLTFDSDSGNSIHLYSQDLHSFKQECFFFFQQDNLYQILYTSRDRGIRMLTQNTSSSETIEWFWQVLVKNFAAITSETGKKLIFLIEEDDKKLIVNCSQDFKIKFQGTPNGCILEELLRRDININRLWWIHTLDGKTTSEKLWLKRKDLLASFNNQRNFWMYQFSQSQRVASTSIPEMAHHQLPISSVSH